LQRATTVGSIVSPGGRRGQQTLGEVMLKIARYALFAFGLVLLPISASAEDSTVKRPQEIVYKAPCVGYPEVAVLYGDPSKPELYVQRVKFAPGFKVMPHWHPEETRTLVVLSGTLYFGFGDTWDESKLTAFPAGTFFAEPRKTPHFAWAKDGEVIVQVTGVGPSGVMFIDQSNK
jgi:quercetin dioxygenase-like cupin family protein